MTGRALLHRWNDLELDKVTEMVARKIVRGAQQSLGQSYLKKGALVPRHAHDGEQMIYVLQGALRVVVDAEEVTMREGDVLVIPTGQAHQVEALDDTFVMDVRGVSAAMQASSRPGEEADVQDREQH
jgi:quercetin dioxygenase-like cupin family protein